MSKIVKNSINKGLDIEDKILHSIPDHKQFRIIYTRHGNHLQEVILEWNEERKLVDPMRWKKVMFELRINNEFELCSNMVKVLIALEKEEQYTPFSETE